MGSNPGNSPRNSGSLQAHFLGNWPGLIGISLALVGVMSGLLIFALSLLSEHGIAYLDLLYLGVAGLVLLGVFLACIGAFTSHSRIRRGLPHKPITLMTVDLNSRKHQISALAAVVLGVIGIGVITTTSYQSLHYVESDEFCSQACHSVMKPEGDAHLNSAHAKVPCVACHVGSGAGSFVKAKLNGLNQVKGIITGDFSRPIQTPVHNMRPAIDTCESCHWRDRWIGHKEKSVSYYSGKDESNTLRKMSMLINVGGTRPGGTKGEGIHYHMMLGRKVEFIARDRQRQVVPYIKVTEADGTVREFNDSEKPLTDEERKTLHSRQMDCLDCHNRPAHQYKDPMSAMNIAMEAGAVDPELPNIKRKGVDVLSAVYETTEEGEKKIPADLLAYYQEEYPEVLTENKAGFDKAVLGILDIFRKNMFPEMKVRWSAYPDNIGHRDSQGCFRCHNDRMVDKDDEPIVTECKACHVVLAQGSDITKVEADLTQGLAFFHPDDEDFLKEYSDCAECHTGGSDTYEE